MALDKTNTHEGKGGCTQRIPVEVKWLRKMKTKEKEVIRKSTMLRRGILAIILIATLSTTAFMGCAISLKVSTGHWEDKTDINGKVTGKVCTGEGHECIKEIDAHGER